MKYQPGVMTGKFGSVAYETVASGKQPRLPTLQFLSAICFGPMFWLWRKAARNECDDTAWTYGSAWVANILENMGGRIVIDGLDHIGALQEPCIFIANHMSTLETFLLPGIIRPFRPLTFVVKKSLTTMPVFGPIMRSRDPIVVKRVNPREDLTTILTECPKRLNKGISIVVFPQHTRSLNFDESLFNSIGVKLASKTGAPVIPVALKTDAWGQGKKIKELGAFRPDLPARFRFGPVIRISGNGKKEHAEICRFIGSTVARWQAEDGINS